MTGEEWVSPEIQAGQVFLQQRRLEDAERSFMEALGTDPEDGLAHYLLAFTRYRADRDREALVSINQAIGNTPDSSDAHALKARILVALHKRKEAMSAADRAIELDPASSEAWSSKAVCHQIAQEWSRMETAAREALSRDPDSGDAANALATALRLQGKKEENAARIQDLLFRDPLNPATHDSAGWSALQAGDRKKAEEHFLEALRIDPTLESARSGLVECFKARSWFYRLFLQYSFRMARIKPSVRWGILIGVLVGVRLLGPLSALLMPLYLLFVLWTHLASGISSFIILLDRRARLALTDGEKLEGLWVGGGLFAGIGFIVVGVGLNMVPLVLLGVGLAASTMPAAYAFTNESPRGALLFRGFAGVALTAGVVACLFSLTQSGSPGGALAVGLLTALLSTWIANTSLVR